MKNLYLLRLVIFSFIVFFPSFIHAMNWLRPYDVLVRPEMDWTTPWNLTNWTETGIKPARGFNTCDESVNALQLWQSDQDALAMLNGFDASTVIGQKRIQVNAIDDGVRGHLRVTGDLKEMFTTIFGMYYKFHHYFWFAAYLPVMEQRLENVCWKDLTQSITPDDLRVKNYLTNNFFSQVDSLNAGLCLGNWRRVGLGDMVFMIEWLKNYPQRREILKNVMLNWCCGFNIPTGKRTAENHILALPFGYDGSWGVIFGGGLRVTLGDTFRVGADVRLTHLVGNTHCRRIKTAADQTEFLFLAKTPAFKDFGMIQLFSLYAQAYHLCRGFSLLGGYQFLKQGASILQLETCQYATSIANTAVSLREWMVHQIVISASYDIGYDHPDACVLPQASLFFRIPFDGRRSVAFTTIGAMISLQF